MVENWSVPNRDNTCTFVFVRTKSFVIKSFHKNAILVWAGIEGTFERPSREQRSHLTTQAKSPPFLYGVNLTRSNFRWCQCYNGSTSNSFSREIHNCTQDYHKCSRTFQGVKMTGIRGAQSKPHQYPGNVTVYNLHMDSMNGNSTDIYAYLNQPCICKTY